MFIVSVMFSVLPDKGAEINKVIKENSNIKELAGCVRFDFYKDPEIQNKYFLYEEWETEADFTAYKESEKFKDFSSKLFSMMDGKPTSTYYSAEVVMQS